MCGGIAIWTDFKHCSLFLVCSVMVSFGYKCFINWSESNPNSKSESDMVENHKMSVHDVMKANVLDKKGLEIRRSIKSP